MVFLSGSEYIGIQRNKLNDEVCAQIGRIYCRTMLGNEDSIYADIFSVQGVEGLFEDGYRFGSPVTEHSKFRAHQDPGNIVHFDLFLNEYHGEAEDYNARVRRHNALKKNRDNQLPFAEQLQGVLRSAIAEYLEQSGLASSITTCRYMR